MQHEGAESGTGEGNDVTIAYESGVREGLGSGFEGDPLGSKADVI